MINLLLNNFDPVIYRRVQKESDESLCTLWSLVTVRNQLPAQAGKVSFRLAFDLDLGSISCAEMKLRYFFNFEYIQV